MSKLPGIVFTVSNQVSSKTTFFEGKLRSILLSNWTQKGQRRHFLSNNMIKMTSRTKVSFILDQCVTVETQRSLIYFKSYWTWVRGMLYRCLSPYWRKELQVHTCTLRNTVLSIAKQSKWNGNDFPQLLYKWISGMALTFHNCMSTCTLYIWMVRYSPFSLAESERDKEEDAGK